MSNNQFLKIRQNLGFIGSSPALDQILRTIEQVASTNILVLINGESGTGKELVAKAIHALSDRKEGPFVVVNAGAIPEGIMESELFGHEKGSFTGAIGQRKGYFEIAEGGTIFLDEIGEMPLETQVRLLRVLENREILRVGGSASKSINVRIIAATNRDLLEDVHAGRFREDLYYRLNAVNVKVPSLRERKEDVPLLIHHFATEFCNQNRIEYGGFTDEAIDILINYGWPGNIRELKNFVESIIVMEKGMTIGSAAVRARLPVSDVRMNTQLPVHINRSNEELEREFLYRALFEIKNEIAQLREAVLGKYIMPNRRLMPGLNNIEKDQMDFVANDFGRIEEETEDVFPTVNQMEHELIYRALEKTGGNKRKAAVLLAISERTLYRKIKEYGLPF
ncbi:MAG: sigma-54-dependent Fis family transcriptional regulator [Calditrichaeota bacterium]|nr:MAG: sigma-54-dependent Fis family transcriptional regulator [Calditrichota bacterium]